LYISSEIGGQGKMEKHNHQVKVSRLLHEISQLKHDFSVVTSQSVRASIINQIELKKYSMDLATGKIPSLKPQEAKQPEPIQTKPKPRTTTVISKRR
jgi:hypothetical protein